MIPKAQCLRGEYHFDKTFLEQTFDNLTEQGDHAGMMRCKSFLQGKRTAKMQSLQILLAELSIDHSSTMRRMRHLTVAGQSRPALMHCSTAQYHSHGEDEIDAGQHIEKVQLVHYGPAFGVCPPPYVRIPGRATGLPCLLCLRTLRLLPARA